MEQKRMTNALYGCTPMYRSQIWEIARMFRARLNIESELYLNVANILEKLMTAHFMNFNFEIVKIAEMPDREGETVPLCNLIRIREDIYDKMCEDDGRSRFTVMHEIGHYILLATDMALKVTADISDKFLLSSAESQANEFAAEALAPIEKVKCMTVEEISQNFGLSLDAARVQYNKANGR